MNDEDHSQAKNLLESIQRNKCRISQAVEVSRTIHQAFLTTCNSVRELRQESNEQREELTESLMKQAELMDSGEIVAKQMESLQLELQEREKSITDYSNKVIELKRGN